MEEAITRRRREVAEPSGVIKGEVQNDEETPTEKNDKSKKMLRRKRKDGERL